jgi:hypothetical protein
MLFVKSVKIGVVVESYGEAGLPDGIFLSQKIVEQI